MKEIKTPPPPFVPKNQCLKMRQNDTLTPSRQLIELPSAPFIILDDSQHQITQLFHPFTSIEKCGISDNPDDFLNILEKHIKNVKAMRESFSLVRIAPLCYTCAPSFISPYMGGPDGHNPRSFDF